MTTADASIAATDQYHIRQNRGAERRLARLWPRRRTPDHHLVLGEVDRDRDISGLRSVTTRATDPTRPLRDQHYQHMGTQGGHDPGGYVRHLALRQPVRPVGHLAANVGSNFISTPNSWIAGDFLAGGTPANAMDTIGNRLKLALVQVEEGIGASPFEAFRRTSCSIAAGAITGNSSRSGPRRHRMSAACSAPLLRSRMLPRPCSATASSSIPTCARRRRSRRIIRDTAKANWRDTTNGADRTMTVSDQSESGFVLTGAAGAAAASNYIHWQASADL